MAVVVVVAGLVVVVVTVEPPPTFVVVVAWLAVVVVVVVGAGAPVCFGAPEPYLLGLLPLETRDHLALRCIEPSQELSSDMSLLDEDRSTYVTFEVGHGQSNKVPDDQFICRLTWNHIGRVRGSDGVELHEDGRVRRNVCTWQRDTRGVGASSTCHGDLNAVAIE